MNHEFFIAPRELKGKEDTMAVLSELFDLAEREGFKFREVTVDSHTPAFRTQKSVEITIQMITDSADTEKE